MKSKPNKEELNEMYVVKKMKQKEIAKNFSVCSTTVSRWMSEFGIKSRSRSEFMKGENNSNFGKKAKLHGKRIWYICPNEKTVSMRSSWEASFAKYLDKKKIYWEYEPKTFILSDGSAYTPDFYLPKTKEWIEVKGWLTDVHKYKIDLWKKENVNDKFILADRSYLLKCGIDLKKIWKTSKPKFECIQCKKMYHRACPDQKLCSILCRNIFVAKNKKFTTNIEQIIKEKRKYNGSQSGQNNNSTKLSLKDIDEIRTMRRLNVPVVEIARIKNSSASNIYNICRGYSWKHKL